MDILQRKERLERLFIEEAKNKKKQKEIKRKEDIADLIKGMSLFPKVKDVLEDEELECFFRPILTIKQKIKGKEFLIHILLSLGVFEEKLSKGYKFSENGFFGFEYNGGKYKYLGNKDVFYDYEKVSKLNRYLQADFIEQKEIYLSNKITMASYVERMIEKIRNLVQCGKCDVLNRYLESFYSYELTKYQYQATGNFISFKEITKGIKTSSDFIFNENSISSIVEEFFLKIEYNLKNLYKIKPEMACFGIDAFYFMEHKDMLITFLDTDTEKVYMLEYCS